MEKSVLTYKEIEGHIILLCKNHYKIKEGLVESLKMIWAIRCGYEYDKKDNSSLRYIMNELYTILLPTITDHSRFQDQLHDYITSWVYKDFTLEERVIKFYCSQISNLKVKEKISDNKWQILINLPKPKKILFNRILRGNGRYEDYKLISEV